MFIRLIDLRSPSHDHDSTEQSDQWAPGDFARSWPTSVYVTYLKRISKHEHYPTFTFSRSLWNIIPWHRDSGYQIQNVDVSDIFANSKSTVRFPHIWVTLSGREEFQSRNRQCMTTRTWMFVRHNKSELRFLVDWLSHSLAEWVDYLPTLRQPDFRPGTAQKEGQFLAKNWRHLLQSDIFRPILKTDQFSCALCRRNSKLSNAVTKRITLRDLFRKGIFPEQKRNESSSLKMSVREDYCTFSDVAHIDSRMEFRKAVFLRESRERFITSKKSDYISMNARMSFPKRYCYAIEERIVFWVLRTEDRFC